MRIEGSKDAFTMPVMNVASHGDAVSKERVKVPKMQEEKPVGDNEPKKPVKEEDFFRMVQDANDQLKVYDRRLEFSIHDETHRIMVKVIDTTDDSVIREIPSEKALDMLAYAWKVSGILLDEKR